MDWAVPNAQPCPQRLPIHGRSLISQASGPFLSPSIPTAEGELVADIVSHALRSSSAALSSHCWEKGIPLVSDAMSHGTSSSNSPFSRKHFAFIRPSAPL
jgi:hypothetical protein